ncbi:hypothetical protein D3C81_1372160 [compost metagenome]
MPGAPLHVQGVHQRHQRRLADVSHQGQLVNRVRQRGRLIPAQAVKEFQPGPTKVRKVAVRQALLQRFRGGFILCRRRTFAVRQHPVEFVPARLHHFFNSWLNRLLPGLTGEHPRHHLRGTEQTCRVCVAGHVIQTHINIQVCDLREHLLVQGGFAVAHAHQANQQRTRLADHALICRQTPLRMSRQLRTVKRQQ